MLTPSYLNLKERSVGDSYNHPLKPWLKHPQKYKFTSHVHGNLGN